VLLTGDWHTAEDLGADVPGQAVPGLAPLDTGADPDSYLRRMLVNNHRSWWRVSWRREAPVELIPDRAVGADGQDRHAVAETVRQALAALPAGSARCWCCASSRTCR
jgi:DNA-directed RNA polymerase specialized sigma24 family protein